MDEKSNVLKVHILGGFSITYGSDPISFKKNKVSKATKLLQLLLYQGSKGMSREALLEELYGREDIADVSNNLRVTMYRLKKMLTGAGLPPYEYVTIKNGIYRWEAPMETEVDAHRFMELLEQEERVDSQSEKIELLRQACLIYGGELLPDLSSEDWILMEAGRYKNKYANALNKLCDMLMKQGEYEAVLKLCAPACQMYPFDEWQTIRISCFISMNRYKEAMQEYEDTAALLFDELGVSPSEKMLQQFDIMSNQIHYKPQALQEIQDRLKEEEEEEGAYYCHLPSFRDNYRFVSRIIERNGQAVFLMLCNLVNGKGQPMENEAKREIMMEELQRVIKQSLRRGDAFAKYSPSQFVILLVGTNKEDCCIIYDRIRRMFSAQHKSWSRYLTYVVSSVADIDKAGAPIRFDKKEPMW